MSKFDPDAMTKHYDNWKDFDPTPYDWNARWPNFSVEELKCRDGSFKLHPPSLDKLQALRTKIGVPMRINSAYRSPAYNRKVGGATRSQHLEARAFDVSMAGHSPTEYAEAALAVGFYGIGYYPTFTHVDNRASKKKATWNTKHKKEKNLGIYKRKKHTNASDNRAKRNAIPKARVVGKSTSIASNYIHTPNQKLRTPTVREIKTQPKSFWDTIASWFAK